MHSRTRRTRWAAALAAAALLPSLLNAAAKEHRPLPPIKPQVESARRGGSRVFLEGADKLLKSHTDSFMVVTGNVHFSRGAMQMYCDSAHYYPDTESMDAFGHVRMEQGDTLFVYADELNYRGDREVAVLYGTPAAPVRMINRSVTLTTDEFVYDLRSEFGYYYTGGTLTDDHNRLVSLEGEYIPATKEANFYTDVRLTSIRDAGSTDTLRIATDTLFYNTATHIAQLTSPTVVSNRQATIFTDDGDYNTATSEARLFSRSRVVTSRGSTLEGDTLFYDRRTGIGEAFGAMALTDSIRQTSLRGDYGYYNELTDSAYVTGHALAMEYSRPDTLYMHGRQIEMMLRIDTVRTPADTLAGTPETVRLDSTHVTVAYPRVRFFRNDIQGVCDSMRFVEADSTLHMLRHPIVWSDNRQIFGNIIQVHLNDSTVDRATLPDMAFSAQHVDEDMYNQLSGKTMVAYFENSELRRLDVDGNVEAIMLPMENDSTYNKVVNMESSHLTATFAGRALQRMKTWPATSGTVTPLYLARKSLFTLPRFVWYGSIRPSSPEDIFIVPPEMDALMAQ